MSDDSEEKERTKVDSSKKREQVRRRISNQYSILHHSERYIINLIKIISIIIGIVSFLGVPQFLQFQHENVFLVTVD